MEDETLKKVAALFGEDAVRVVEVLQGVDEIVDIEIADKTQIRLNMVRKALYRLYDHSLVALRQSRDKETGWFIFNWRLQPDRFGCSSCSVHTVRFSGLCVGFDCAAENSPSLR